MKIEITKAQRDELRSCSALIRDEVNQASREGDSPKQQKKLRDSLWQVTYVTVFGYPPVGTTWEVEIIEDRLYLSDVPERNKA